MRLPAIVILVYCLFVLGVGVTSGSMGSVIVGSAFGLGLLASGLGVLWRKELGFVFASLIILLLTSFFAYRLVLSSDFVPSRLMGILGLVALVLYFAVPAKERL